MSITHSPVIMLPDPALSVTFPHDWHMIAIQQQQAPRAIPWNGPRHARHARKLRDYAAAMLATFGAFFGVFAY